ncbi:MAG: hypothetical protein ACOX0F_13730 [Syntrophomonadaceae bacterium]|jgi:hypothetical protein
MNEPVQYVQRSSCKVIYLPLATPIGITDKKVPTEEQLMEMIGRQLPSLCLALGAVLITHHYGWWIIPAVIGAGMIRWSLWKVGWLK